MPMAKGRRRDAGRLRRLSVTLPIECFGAATVVGGRAREQAWARVTWGYLVVKLPVADDSWPEVSRLDTWNMYEDRRESAAMVTEWLVTRVRSSGVVLP